MSPLIRWSTIPRTIESHREQWSCLQQGLFLLEDVDLFWHRDLMILDLLINSPSSEEKEHLWNSISKDVLGIQIQVSKLFSKDTTFTKWQDIHEQTIRKCARHMAGDIHIWH